MRRLALSLRRAFAAALAVFLAWPLTAGLAEAHPHVWIDSYVRVIFDENDHVVALEIDWRFDEFYSIFAIEGLDKDGDGKLAEAELRPLAELNITSLESYRYFTYVTVDGTDAAYGEVREYSSSFAEEEGILSLRFVLPLTVPVDPRQAELSFTSYDPSFYISIEPRRQDAIELSDGAPEVCEVLMTRGAETETLNFSDADLFGNAQSIAARFASHAALDCSSQTVTQ